MNRQRAFRLGVSCAACRRMMHHPAIGEVIRQGLHLPRNMEGIGRRAEKDQIGALHGGKDGRKRGSPAACLLPPADAGTAAHADMRHIPRQMKGKEFILPQKCPDEQLCDVVAAGLRLSPGRVNYGDIHTHPSYFSFSSPCAALPASIFSMKRAICASNRGATASLSCAPS